MTQIIDLVRARKDVMKDPGEAEKTSKLATAAIMAGIGTPEWKNYMEHFDGLNSDQLKRLLAEDGTLGNEAQDARRAYMVANGMCGIQSPDTQGLDFNVVTIDDGLPGDPQP